MSKTTVYLNDKTLQDLKKISEDSGKSISKISAELIEEGLNLHQEQQEDAKDISVKKMSKREINHYITTTVALNLIFEVFKKLNKEPSKNDGENAADIVNEAREAALKKLKEL